MTSSSSSSRSGLLVMAGMTAMVGASVVCFVFLVSRPKRNSSHHPSTESDNKQPTVVNDGTSSMGGVDSPMEIKNELFSRVRSFFGEEEYKNLQKRFVIVVGLGGVGSHAANMLVRSGVSRLRLVDFDQVTLSSLNRHAVASMDDVGISKAEAMRRKLLKIVPWCQIEAITEMFKKDSADALLAGDPDFVLDCIDDVSTKAELIAYCVKKDIKVLTSMGAGGKADPTRLRISALSDCTHDPLASKIKWKLKKHDVMPEQVMSVFSVEQPIMELLPLEEEQKNAPQDYGVVDYLRLRVIPVLGTSPSIFGQAMASYVLCSMAGKLYEPESCERLSKAVKHKLRQVLESTEIRRFHVSREDMDLDDDDIEFIVQQVWRTRCAATGRKIGGHAPMVITRWHLDKPLSPYNLVLMQRTLSQQLEQEGQTCFSSEIVESINQRLAWAEQVCAGSWSSPSSRKNTSREESKKKLSQRSSSSSSSSSSTFVVLVEAILQWHHPLNTIDTNTFLLLALTSATVSTCCYAMGLHIGLQFDKP